ncbi:MAG TPA: hypothetical protein VL977_07190, partial [Solirubrobacteraceae bacterium]|nr:hypothetical protein [Solirubrobacteraceae bacterium]
MSEPDAPAQDTVLFASPAVVKRRRTSYGKPGILAATPAKLVFVAHESGASWQLDRAAIVRLRKPWYGLGSYITFQAHGEYYALALGRRGPSPALGSADVARALGGMLALPATAIADAA